MRNLPPPAVAWAGLRVRKAAYPTGLARASANDLMELATDTPAAPQHVAAVLRLDETVEPETVRDVLAARVPAVPRLRQRLMRAPLGGGRPLWVDDADFDMSRHLTVRDCPAPGDPAALMQLAATAAMARLPRDRPLWTVTVVTGLAGGGTALVLVMHHVLTDGIGGLAALASLMDQAPGPAARAGPFPAAPPSPAALRVEAARSRIHALAGLPRTVRLARAAAAQLRPGRPARQAACSLNRPIGPRRRLAVTAVTLAELIELAHHHDATVNDVLLTAVAGALAAVVSERGERVGSFVISVPVSARRETAATDLGNQVGVIAVQVPTVGRGLDRLAAVAAQTQLARRGQGRGASAPLLAAAFRLLARIGVFAWFVNHQRLVTTFVTNIRGPETPMEFAGARVIEVIPISSIAGNVTVAFAALSYCATLIVTVIADPDHCPDLARIATALQEELGQLARSAPADGP